MVDAGTARLVNGLTPMLHNPIEAAAGCCVAFPRCSSIRLSILEGLVAMEATEEAFRVMETPDPLLIYISDQPNQKGQMILEQIKTARTQAKLRTVITPSSLANGNPILSS